MSDVDDLTTALVAAKERQDEEAVKEISESLFAARKAEREYQFSRGERQGLVKIEHNTSEEGV